VTSIAVILVDEEGSKFQQGLKFLGKFDSFTS